MFYNCLMKHKKQKDERWVFSIDIDDPMMKYIREQKEWMEKNPNAHYCEFSLDTYRSRFVDVESFGEIVKLPKDLSIPYGEDPLDYYGCVNDYYVPNDDYWQTGRWAIPEENWVALYPNGVSFIFRKDYKYSLDDCYGASGLSYEDFFGK